MLLFRIKGRRRRRRRSDAKARRRATTGTRGTYFDHGFVARPDVYQGVRLEHVVDLVAGVFVQSAHGANGEKNEKEIKKRHADKTIRVPTGREGGASDCGAQPAWSRAEGGIIKKKKKKGRQETGRENGARVFARPADNGLGPRHGRRALRTGTAKPTAAGRRHSSVGVLLLVPRRCQVRGGHGDIGRTQ